MPTFLLALSSLGAWLARHLGAAACLAAALGLVAGCEQPSGPPLIEVTDVTPREVEAGERFELSGSGFPQGRTARVTLEGRVFRGWERPRGRVSIDATGIVTAPDRLEIVVDEELAARLCGRADRATHATFRGDVEVSFASNNPGAPPVVGRLRGITLDVMPSAPRASVLAERAAEGARVLAYLGIVPGAPTGRGIVIERVQPGSIAARAGLRSGGVLTAVDGLSVLSLADVAPASASSAELTIMDAAGEGEETKKVTLAGYSGERIPAEYAPALIIVGLALGVVMLFGLRGPTWLVSIEARLAGFARRATPRAIAAALFGTGAHAALSALLSALVAAFALTPYVVGRELDGALLAVVSASTLVWSRTAAAKGALASARTAIQLGTAALVMIASIALMLGHMGAIELTEIVRMQGGAPWEVTATQKPEAALLGAVYVGSLVAVLRARSAGALPSRARHASLLERAGLVLASSLGVVVFFGGWQLPGVDTLGGRGLALLSATLFVVKTWAFAAFVLGASRLASSLRCSDVPRAVVKTLVPGLVAGAAVAVLSRRLLPSAVVETAFGATVVTFSCLLFLRMAARVHASVTRPHPRPSPFL